MIAFLHTKNTALPHSLPLMLATPPTKTPHHHLMRGWRTKRAIDPLATGVT